MRIASHLIATVAAFGLALTPAAAVLRGADGPKGRKLKNDKETVPVVTGGGEICDFTMDSQRPITTQKEIKRWKECTIEAVEAAYGVTYLPDEEPTLVTQGPGNTAGGGRKLGPYRSGSCRNCQCPPSGCSRRRNLQESDEDYNRRLQEIETTYSTVMYDCLTKNQNIHMPVWAKANFNSYTLGACRLIEDPTEAAEAAVTIGAEARDAANQEVCSFTLTGLPGILGGERAMKIFDSCVRDVTNCDHGLGHDQRVEVLEIISQSPSDVASSAVPVLTTEAISQTCSDTGIGAPQCQDQAYSPTCLASTASLDEQTKICLQTEAPDIFPSGMTLERDCRGPVLTEAQMQDKIRAVSEELAAEQQAERDALEAKLSAGAKDLSSVTTVLATEWSTKQTPNAALAKSICYRTDFNNMIDIGLNTGGADYTGTLCPSNCRQNNLNEANSCNEAPIAGREAEKEQVYIRYPTSSSGDFFTLHEVVKHVDACGVNYDFPQNPVCNDSGESEVEIFVYIGPGDMPKVIDCDAEIDNLENASSLDQVAFCYFKYKIKCVSTSTTLELNTLQ